MSEDAALRVGSAADLGVPAQVVRDFYREHWAAPIALIRTDFYDWQFVDHPGSPGRDNTCVALLGDRVVAVMGLNERVFVLDGSRVRGAEGTTWVVDPAARGLGVGRSMLGWVRQQFEVFAGASITDDALTVYLPEGFHFVRLVPRCVRVFADDLPHDVARANRLGLRLADLRRPPNRTPFSASSVADPTTVDPTLLVGPGGDDPVNGFVRDARYLRWRYVDHPAFPYDLHLVRGRGTGALVATRTDEVDGFRFCHVVDILGDAKDLPAVVAFLDVDGLERGVAITDFTGTNARVLGELRNGGWFSMADEMSLQVTHLFYPIEFRTPPTTSLSLWSGTNMAGLLDTGRLHLTKGDFDLDRPTLAYYAMKGRP